MMMLRSWYSGAMMVTSLVLVGGRYSPPPKIGMPAGLLPDCPGVSKNASISSSSLPLLEVMLHHLDSSGNLVSRSMPVMTAHKLIAKEKINWSRPWLLYAVGWLDSAQWPHSKIMASAYARRGYNVLFSDSFAFFINVYPKSVRLSRTIGQKLGELLVRMVPLGLNGNKLELVGISLGAHVAAFTARHFHAVTGVKPVRLTGLDPAGPCFRSLPPEMRFNEQDAVHTDVIHTNMDGLGIAEPLGHVDFYVNGGEYQPGDVSFIPCLAICSHVKSGLYWWIAIQNPKKFIGIKCNSVQDARLADCYNSTETNYMGLETVWDRPGIYYLSTGYTFPYYRGKSGLRPENEIYTSVIKSMNNDNGLVV